MNNSLVKQSNSVAGAIDQGGFGNNPVAAAMTAKSLAEVQGKVFMAKQFPRQMDVVQAKIQQSCERKSLAEVAEYEYTKGGTTINGASIKLLETIAQCYGNIHSTWKEISRDSQNHKSMCIAEAWDLENNVSSTLEFEVSHYRDTKGGPVLVTSERDLYELVASNAARRLRKCLENIVPRDIVDDARRICDETLVSKVDVQKGIDKALEVFKETYGISLKQIETYFGMGRQGFTKNTYVKLQKLFISFRDGVADPSEVFKPETSNTAGVGNTLKPSAEGQTVGNNQPTTQPNDEPEDYHPENLFSPKN
jgi:hypothetical protein